MKEDGKNYTYILRCADGTLYTGWTNDLQKRLRSHNAGQGAKYTRPRTPVSLFYSETFATREEAMRRECEIKRLSRSEKERLAERKEGAAAPQNGRDAQPGQRTERREEAPPRGIVAFDLDCTLLDNAKNEICPSALSAVKKLRAAGYIVAIASGRDMDNYYSYMHRDLVQPDAIVHQNGTRVSVREGNAPYDQKKGSAQYRPIFDHFMDPALVREIVQYAKEHHLCVGTTIDGRDYFTEPEQKAEADASYNQFLKRNFVPIDGLFQFPVRAMSYAGRDAAEREAFLKRFPHIRLLMFSSGAGADMVEDCCSKAQGLELLCRHYGVPKERTWAFGDSENDIEIIKAAGTGIAVGNAMPEVKAAADYAADDIRNDGIYKACAALGLIEAQGQPDRNGSDFLTERK